MWSGYNGHSPLAAGGNYQDNISFTLATNGFAGSMYLLLVTDSYNQQGEINENNNVLAEPITVSAPDLQVSNLSISPNTNVQTGNQVAVSWSDTNNGNAPVVASFSDSITIRNLTTNQTLATYPVAYNASTHGAIVAGTSAAQQAMITIPDGYSGVGNLQITVTVNANGAINEGNSAGTGTTNNTASTTLTTTLGPYPDLLVSAIVAPADGWSGTVVTVGWTVENQGNAATAGTWLDSVSLRNATTGMTTLLGTLSSPENLSPGQSYTRSSDFTLPNGISGDYEIVVTANSNGAVFEANTANDTSTSASFPVHLSPYPDLQVATVTVPVQATAGQPVTISWTVTNAGTGATDVPAWNNTVYLSTSPTLNPSTAVNLGSVQNPSYLAGGELLLVALGYHPEQPKRPVLRDRLHGLGQRRIRVHLREQQHDGQHHDARDQPGAGARFHPCRERRGHAERRLRRRTGNRELDGPEHRRQHHPRGRGGLLGRRLRAVAKHDLGRDERLLARRPPGQSPNHAARAGQTSNHQSTTTLPQNISGTWYLIIVPDTHYFAGGNGQIGAGNIPRDQGYAVMQITLTPEPDLQVTAVAAGHVASSGGPISVSWTVGNEGFGPTGTASWSDAVYLSTSTTLQTSGSNAAVLLGTFGHTGILRRNGHVHTN